MAQFGTPAGTSCGSASGSNDVTEIASSYCLGLNGCTPNFSADGDPCPGTIKTLTANWLCTSFEDGEGVMRLMEFYRFMGLWMNL